MECNKDEATRAKQIAEEKMEKNDFEGARKIAVKAQNLYPELENITQILTVCNVHCAAKNKIKGSDKDWYGILDVDRLADDSTIKKQYRRLALVLHPDKNRFPGAEAAFKLIGEANLVLTDPAKRSLFDSKTRVSVRSFPSSQPPHQVNNPSFKKQYGFQNKFPNFSADNFSGQAMGFNSNAGQPMFWTSCPFCAIKFPCQREKLNQTLQCHYCLKTFLAVDVGAQGVSSQHGVQQHVFPKSGIPNQGAPKMGVQSNTRFPFPAARSRGSASRGDNVKENETRNVYSMHGENKRGGFPNGDVKNQNRKRGRKKVVESSESCDTSSSVDTDDVTIKEKFQDPSNRGDSGLNANHFVRRSTRQRQHISYNEGDDDDNDYNDIASPRKRSRSDSKEEQEDSDRANSFHDDAENAGCEEIDDSQANSAATYECPDAEFNDFDKAREESCFDADQLWACYDTLDGMPRFYALVKNVTTSEFKLQITWLEPDPEDEAERNWARNALPVGCGRFKRGSTQKTADRFSFSHQVIYEKGKKRGSLVIYPQKGEIWAVYKDWDIRWSRNPEKHKHFKYEIVEVLSDYVAGVGVKVACLDKVRGFVSLFQRTGESVIDLFFIKPNDLFRFSHRVPCFRMLGTERSGVPEGSFELDPNSIPLNPDDLWYPGKEKAVNNGNLNAGVNNSPLKSTKSNLAPKGMDTSENVVDLED